MCVPPSPLPPPKTKTSPPLSGKDHSLHESLISAEAFGMPYWAVPETVVAAGTGTDGANATTEYWSTVLGPRGPLFFENAGVVGEYESMLREVSRNRNQSHLIESLLGVGGGDGDRVGGGGGGGGEGGPAPARGDRVGGRGTGAEIWTLGLREKLMQLLDAALSEAEAKEVR